MNVTIHLRDTVTGQTVTYPDSYEFADDDDDYGMLYVWVDGNYGCDCNRSSFFGLDLPCSPRGSNRIVIDKIVTSAGVTYDDTARLNTGGAVLFKPIS